MLNVMDRYVKLFLSDKEMKQSYKKEKTKATKLPNFDKLPTLESYLFDSFAKREIAPLSSYSLPKHHSVLQLFSFCPPIMSYIIKTSTLELQHKLMKSCRQIKKKISNTSMSPLYLF